MEIRYGSAGRPVHSAQKLHQRSEVHVHDPGNDLCGCRGSNSVEDCGEFAMHPARGVCERVRGGDEVSAAWAEEDCGHRRGGEMENVGA